MTTSDEEARRAKARWLREADQAVERIVLTCRGQDGEPMRVIAHEARRAEDALRRLRKLL